jgi:chromosome segregation ATPase
LAELDRLDSVTQKVTGVKADLTAKTAELESVRSELESIRRAPLETPIEDANLVENDPLVERIHKYQNSMKELITAGAEHNLKAIEQFEREVTTIEGANSPNNVRQELIDRVTALRTQLSSLEKTLAEHEKNRSVISKERDAVHKQLTGLLSSMQNLKSKQAGLSARLGDLSLKIGDLETELAQMTTPHVESSMNQVTEKLEKARARLHEKKEEHKTLHSRVNDARNRVDSALKTFKAEIDAARSHVHSLHGERGLIDAAIQKLKRAAARDEKSELATAMTKMDAEIHSIIESIKHSLSA